VKNFELISFATADKLASHVAGAWLAEIEKARHSGKPYGVALSGGRITQKFFAAVVNLVWGGRRVGAPNFRDGDTPSLPNNVHFFWADERCVPPDDPESNFKLADELLFKPLKIPNARIHRIRGEESPAAAVKDAGSELRQIALPGENGQPVLDLVFLGMGEDGHVASLFPNAPVEVVDHPGPFLFVQDSPKPPPRRVSLSYATIAAARQVWVLISGAGKEEALSQSLGSGVNTPLGRILEKRQITRIFSEIRPK
jgi:6-phosphogluconolactonase